MAGNKSYQVGFVFGAKKASSFDKTLGGINKSLSGMTKGVGNVMKGMAGFAAAKAGLNGIGDAVDTYKGFEQSMANVKALSGASGETFGALKDKAMEMGRKTSKTAQEAADALGYMSLAGWDAEKSMTALEPVLRLSEAGGLDLARTSDLVTDSMSALGIEAEQLPKFLDQVAKTSGKSNTNIDALMEAFVRAGGSLKDMPLEEVNATLGVLANRGLKGAEAGTAISSLMANFKVKSGQAYEALKALGVSAYDAQGNFKGIEATMMELNEATKGLTKEQRDMYFTMIGGKEQAKALDSILSGLNTVNAEGINEFEALKRAAAGSGGALMDMANAMNDTMQGAFSRLSSATDDMKIRLVELAGPYVTPFINAMAEKIPKATEALIGGIQRGTEWLQRLSVKFSGVKAYISGMADGLKKLFAGDFTGGSRDILSLLGFDGKSISVIESFVAQAVGNLQRLSIQAKPVFAAVGKAVQSVLPTLQNMQNFFAQRFLPIWHSVFGFITEKVLPPFIRFFQENIPKISNIFNNLWIVIQPIFSRFAEQINRIWNVAQPIISALINGVTGLASGFMTALNGLIQFVAGIFTGDWRKAWEGVKNIFKGIWDGLVAIVKVPVNKIISLMNKAIDGVNGISFKVPEGVPLIGGLGFDGFNIPQISMLAQGGVATAPTLAMIGEGRENEAILPLSKLDSMISPRPAQQSVTILNPVLPYLRQIVGQLDSTPPALPDRDMTALLQKILDALDKDPPPGGGGPVQITYAPRFIIQGNASKEDLKEAANMSYEQFKEWAKQYEWEQRRVTIRR